MQIEELFDLTSWIEKEIIAKQIQQSYSGLLTILQNNAQPSATNLSFEVEKESLIANLKSVELDLLSTGQLDVLAEIGIAPLVGYEGVADLEDILFKNVIDIATTVSKVSVKINTLAVAIEWSRNTRTVLARVINADEVRELSDEAILRVHFQKEAHLDNLTEFRDWGKSWYEIGRGISMAHGESPENLKVIGASKGSIIITLATSYSIAKTASYIILEALKIIDKVYEIKKKAQEIRQLKLTNDEASTFLENAAKNEKEAGKVAILDKTITQLKLTQTLDGEQSKSLEKAIGQLVDFIEKGGEVDFIVPEESEAGEESTDAKTRAELRVIFKEVRQIERKLNLVEFKEEPKKDN